MPKGNGIKVFQNGRVRTSENPVLYKGNENTGKTVKINIFRNLAINQILATFSSILLFYWLNLSNNGVSVLLLLM